LRKEFLQDPHYLIIMHFRFFNGCEESPAAFFLASTVVVSTIGHQSLSFEVYM
jgi:hypothetical protein